MRDESQNPETGFSMREKLGCWAVLLAGAGSFWFGFAMGAMELTTTACWLPVDILVGETCAVSPLVARFELIFVLVGLIIAFVALLAVLAIVRRIRSWLGGDIAKK